MTLELGPIVVVAVLGLAVAGFGVMMLARARHTVPADRALLLARVGQAPKVVCGGPVAVFAFGAVEWLSLAAVEVPLSLVGRRAPRCRDGLRVELEMSFRVRVNATPDDVLRVARSFGCARASDREGLAELLGDRFASAVLEALGGLDSDQLLRELGAVRDCVMAVLGTDLDGFVLEDVSVLRHELVPIAALDPHDPRDAEAIALMTERSALAVAKANELRQHERMMVTKQDVQAAEAILTLERTRAEAEARRDREIAIVQARERGEVERARLEEARKTNELRIRLAEELAANGAAPEVVRAEWVKLAASFRADLDRSGG